MAKRPSATRTANSEAITSILTSTRSNVQSVQVLEKPVEFLQSLELVQTLVCAVVSTVASLRGIFPEDCFKVHRFDVEDPNYSYQAFIKVVNEEDIALSNKLDKKGHRYVPWEILSRGTNSSVDKILDWLVCFSVEISSILADKIQEVGVADALSHKYLSTLQLGIYKGEVAPSKRVEAYVMGFSYCRDSVDMELQLSGGLSLASQSNKTLVNAKEELRYLVHRLTNHVGGFPELPRETPKSYL